MPKLDLDSIEATNRTTYPMPFAAAMAGRWYRRLAPAAGLSDFGVSHVVLKPGGISSQRHWHNDVDEFLVIVAGEAALVEDDGETLLKAGDCAAFPKGAANGHHLVNRGGEDCVFVVVGSTDRGACHYPDVDLHWDPAAGAYRHKDGTRYA
ncbi:MAG TPA: cupin domain-containing protein [Propylenella sp.]|nr:cupin domain-containing protein [Propylenella sp.]